MVDPSSDQDPQEEQIRFPSLVVDFVEAFLDLPHLVVRKPYSLELVELVAVQVGIVQAKFRNELVLVVVVLVALPYLDHH